MQKMKGEVLRTAKHLVHALVHKDGCLGCWSREILVVWKQPEPGYGEETSAPGRPAHCAGGVRLHLCLITQGLAAPDSYAGCVASKPLNNVLLTQQGKKKVTKRLWGRQL